MNLPSDLKLLIERGVIDEVQKQSETIRIYDVRFLAIADIRPSSLVEEQAFDVLPFAKNAAGDYWGFVSDELPFGNVTLFPHDYPEAKRECATVMDLIFRQTIRFASQRTLNTSGVTAPDARRRIRAIAKTFSNYLDDNQVVLLNRICDKAPVQQGNYGLTLISAQDAAEILIGTDIDAAEIDWFE